NRGNDTIRKTTTTRGHDVQTAGMNIGGRVKANSPITPRITLRSTDYTERNFRAWCRIDSAGTQVFRDSTDIDSVPEGGSRTFSFPRNWNVGPAGATYNITMWHNCGPDQNRTNDTLRGTATATDQIRILMLYSDYGPPDTTLGVRLKALGDSIEYMDVQNATPTLAQLMPYDAVGAQSNYAYSNKVALGDTLAAYVDAGGGVVLGHFSFASGWEMGGAIMTGNYATITAGSNTHSNTTMGWYNSAHPVMAGVDSVREYYAGTCNFVATAESVARWADGRPYVAVSANQKVVGLNQYPGIYSRTPPQRGGDWALVWHNAFAFVSGSVVGAKEFDPFAPALHVTLSTAPNPAMREVLVSYMVRSGEQMNIGIFDQTGRLVKTLVSGPARPGLSKVVWDLKDNDGRSVAAGVYFCKLVAGDKTQTKKLVIE
ncbi:MAG: T9SS type A sorting domain-containing protein, partial [candidate division WOR-3 bacterium]